MKFELPTGKRASVDKANRIVLISVAVAAVVATFSIVASNALWGQRGFQDKVIRKKEAALEQLIENKNAVDSLVSSYTVFVQQQPNMIGGNAQGNGERDGDNARLVLDSLPSLLDEPALASSIEKILNEEGLRATSISVNSEASLSSDSSSADTSTVTSADASPISFEFSVNTNLSTSQRLFEALQHSIRPINIYEFSLESSGSSSIMVNVKATTYYKLGRSLDITTETIR